MTGKIFVNYRRDDSAPYALSVAQYLERKFGASFSNVFRLAQVSTRLRAVLMVMRAAVASPNGSLRSSVTRIVAIVLRLARFVSRRRCSRSSEQQTLRRGCLWYAPILAKLGYIPLGLEHLGRQRWMARA